MDWRHSPAPSGCESTPQPPHYAVPSFSQHFSHSILALEAAVDGLGITVSTPALARDELRNGKLIKPFPFEMPLSSSYYLLSNENVARREAVAAFREWAFVEAQNERDEHARTLNL